MCYKNPIFTLKRVATLEKKETLSKNQTGGSRDKTGKGGCCFSSTAPWLTHFFVLNLMLEHTENGRDKSFEKNGIFRAAIFFFMMH